MHHPDRAGGVEIVVHAFQKPHLGTQHFSCEMFVLALQHVAGMLIHVFGFAVELRAGETFDALEQTMKSAQSLSGFGQHVVIELDRTAIVRAEQQVSNQLRSVLGKQISDANGVAGRLVHVVDRPLAALGFGSHAGQAVMHPIFHKRLAGAAFALGQFVLMVGEHQIHPAAVEVETFAEDFGAHGRALDVPAGAAFAPGAVPRGLAGLGGLP